MQTNYSFLFVREVVKLFKWMQSHSPLKNFFFWRGERGGGQIGVHRFMYGNFNFAALRDLNYVLSNAIIYVIIIIIIIIIIRTDESLCRNEKSCFRLAMNNVLSACNCQLYYSLRSKRSPTKKAFPHSYRAKNWTESKNFANTSYAGISFTRKC